MRTALQSIIHPATVELLRFQTSAKLKRLLASLQSPRRQLLAVVAVLLGLIWISQAVVAVLFRDAADPEKLAHWIPLGLLIYCVWHLVKTVTRSEIEPFDWTPAEIELVGAAPLTRTQLISYRMASIFSSAIAKALCFSLVMIPDLKIWAAGFIGMLLGLVFVDLSRVCLELIFHGLSKRGRAIVRVCVLGTISGIVILSLSKCLTGNQVASEIASPAALIFFKRLIGEILALTSTPIGSLTLLPFRPFADVILASQFSMFMIGKAVASISIAGSMVLLVYVLDHWLTSRRRASEKLAFASNLLAKSHPDNSRLIIDQKDNQIRIPFRMGGFGSLVWRQLLGAWHYRLTLAVSLGVPILLCCIPLLAQHKPFVMLLNIVGGLVFYSFLLLPSALMLDFRRDANRIVVLKSLPIGPVAMTLGQLAAPVLVCSAFQWTVLMIATFIGSVILWQAIVAAIVLLPINMLIFAIENYIFLLAPYRRNQEGFDVFLRTILTFTAKGVMFAAALAAALAWAFVAKAIGASISDSPAASATIFSVGLWVMTCALAAAFTYGIVRIYRRFDPSQDAPAIS